MTSSLRAPARLPRILSVMLVLAGLSSSSWAAEPPAPDLAAGRSAYDQHCARCHGVQGKGDGVDAKRFYPRPRDLALGVYKFRSTASGTPPSDEDLFRTITVGLPGTNMPDWHHLDEATRWQLVHYLKSLSPIFEQTEPGPVDVAADPGAKKADRAKGKEVYQQLGCAACHGALGRGNGPSASGLVDDWGMPIRSANLTHGWAYRGGSDPHAIMMRVMAGIDGAGMPSYAGAVTPEDAWHLAYYVASLQEPPHWYLIARAAKVHGELPQAGDDPRWDAAERATLRVRNVVTPGGEWASPPTIRAVNVHVLYHDAGAAFRIAWDDPTEDTAAGASDGLALMLKTADARGDLVSLQAWPYAGAPPLDAVAWTAAAGQTLEAVTTDVDALAAAGAAGAARPASGRYEDGRWTLVLHRPLHPEDVPGSAALTADVFAPIAFVIWDGAQPGARAVSPWIDVVLRERAKTSH